MRDNLAVSRSGARGGVAQLYGLGIFWERSYPGPTAAIALVLVALATLRILWQAQRVLAKCVPAGYTGGAS